MNFTALRAALAPLVLAAAVLFATNARAAGLQALHVPAQGGEPELSGAVWTPCAEAPSPIELGPFVLDAVRDCPIAGRGLPLVVLSHGRGGSFLGHRDTAQALADAGFVVAAISHPGDSAQDPARTDELSVFEERPADMRRLVDHLLGPWPGAAAIDPARVGFFGFSRGGYTGLVLAGAEPRFGRGTRLCASLAGPPCDEVRRGAPVPLAHDPRIRAAVIADPLGIFFDAGSFAGVRVPIQLWRSDRGGDGVAPGDVAAIAQRLPVAPELHTVAGAGHFAFLPPCPPALAARGPELCADPPGFDRAAFHRRFNDAVVEFFRRTLAGG